MTNTDNDGSNSWTVPSAVTSQAFIRVGETTDGDPSDVNDVAFNIVLPDVAFFGQKDAQQAIVIKRMVADLNMPLEIEFVGAA